MGDFDTRITKPYKYPYFQVTVKEQYSVDCTGWFQHLSSVGVPVAIIYEPEIRTADTISLGGFSVWRIGVESDIDNNHSILNVDKLPTGYRLVKESNGFSRWYASWRGNKKTQLPI